MTIADLPNWMAIAGLITAGIVAGFGVFDARARVRRKEENDIEDRVINLLKEQNAQLTKKIENYESKFTSLSDKIHRIEGENKVMRDILSGKDDASINRAKRADKAMDTISDLAKAMTQNGKKTDMIMQAVQLTNQNVERLASAIEKHLEAELRVKNVGT